MNRILTIWSYILIISGLFSFIVSIIIIYNYYYQGYDKIWPVIFTLPASLPSTITLVPAIIYLIRLRKNKRIGPPLKWLLLLSIIPEAFAFYVYFISKL